MAAILALLLLILLPATADAQENHARGHNDYKGWASQKTGNCCNNRDCGEVKPEDLREAPDGSLEIRIEGKHQVWDRKTSTWQIIEEGEKWCPIKQEHYVLPGVKSPNWEVSHACIKGLGYSTEDPCTRLMCFMGEPKT